MLGMPRDPAQAPVLGAADRTFRPELKAGNQGEQINDRQFQSEANDVPVNMGMSGDQTVEQVSGSLEQAVKKVGKNVKVMLQKSVLATTGIRSCLLYTSPSPRDRQKSRMPSSA